VSPVLCAPLFSVLRRAALCYACLVTHRYSPLIAMRMIMLHTYRNSLTINITSDNTKNR
jgi:hypothetical protein